MQNPSLLMVEDTDVPFGRYAPQSFADWRDRDVYSQASHASVAGSRLDRKRQESNKAAVDENSYWSPGLVRKIPSAVGKVA